MDGSNPTTIVSTGLRHNSGITVDETSSRIYWLSLWSKHIDTTRLDGSDRKLITSSDFPIGIDIFGDTIYWTDMTYGEIKVIGHNLWKQIIK